MIEFGFSRCCFVIFGVVDKAAQSSIYQNISAHGVGDERGKYTFRLEMSTRTKRDAMRRNKSMEDSIYRSVGIGDSALRTWFIV